MATRSASRREQLQAQRLAQQKKDRQQRIIIAVVGLVVVALIVGVAIWAFHSASRPAAGGAQVPPNATADKSGVYLARGGDGAPTVEIYSDYQCPGCKQFDLALSSAMDTAIASGKVTVILHLRSFLDQSLGNQSSRNAAIASTCSASISDDTFFRFHNEIYKNQPATEGDGFTDDLLSNQIPSTLGITGADLTAFQTCYTDKATAQFVDGMESAAAKTQWTSTPTYLLDGTKVNDKIVNSSTGQPDADLFKQLLGLT